MRKRILILALAVLAVVAAILITVDLLRLTHKPQQIASRATGSAVKGGHVATSVSVPTRPLPPTKSLPSGLMSHLITYAKRVQASKPSFVVPGRSILVIDPSEQYAIAQFKQVWARIQPVAVVWTNTASYAAAEWKAEGYKGNPLPSTRTEFKATPTLTPVAYHFSGGSWRSLGGILRPDQVQDWLKFFG